MRRFWCEAETDWTQHYHRDLREDCYGKNWRGARWLLNHLEGLPEDSRFASAVSGIDRTWTGLHQIMSEVYEMVSISASQKELKKPIEYPNKPVPQEVTLVEQPRRASTKEEIKAFLAQTTGR